MHRTVQFSRQAANVFLHVLTQCNLSCSHCYINPKQHGSTMLPLETVIAWLKVLIGRHSFANLILLGGEPTLHPDLAPTIAAAHAMGYSSITIDTNGYLFNDILNHTSPQLVDFFSFSLDGATAATNDAIRGRGSYEHCLSGIKAARAGGFKTSLIYTVSNMNSHELDQMPVLLADLEIDRFFIQVIGLRGHSAPDGPARKRNLQVPRDQWLQLVPAVAQDAAGRGIPTTYPKVFLDPDEPFECAGRVAHNYFVFPNGRVYRCPLCEDYPLHSMFFESNRLMQAPAINETDLFGLDIPEGCVMNKVIQPYNLSYDPEGRPLSRVACCLLKKEVRI